MQFDSVVESTPRWDAYRRVRLVQICPFFLFSYLYLSRFLIKHSWKTLWIWKLKNGHFQRGLTPRRDAHLGVRLRCVHPSTESSDPNFSKKLCGVHHIVESSSAVCIILQSQAPWCAFHSGVKLLQCASYRGVKLCGVHNIAESNCTPRSQNQNLWDLRLPFKGQTGEILIGVNTTVMKEKIWRTNFWFAQPKILTLRCH